MRQENLNDIKNNDLNNDRTEIFDSNNPQYKLGGTNFPNDASQITSTRPPA